MAREDLASYEAEAADAIALLPPARLGSLLRARRSEARIGRVRAARAAGIDVTALRDIEAGRTTPEVTVLAALLRCYEVPAGAFVPPRHPYLVTNPDDSVEEVLRAYVDAVRKWRKAGRREPLRFRHADIRLLVGVLGTDPEEIERRLIAMTGCSRRDARQLRKWLVASLITLPIAAGLGGSLPSAAAATPGHSVHAAHSALVTTGHSVHKSADAHQLIWSDEFSGPAGAAPDPSKWRPAVGGDGWGNKELESYTNRASNASLDGQGHLAITARRETYTDSSGVTRNYTSARLQTKGLFQTQYGELQARIKLPAGKGLWPAFWALGSTGSWPGCGEIDVMENIGSDPFTIFGSIHGPQTGVSHSYGLITAKHSPVSLAAAFHTYGVTWSPTQIIFTLDGIPYATRTPASLSSRQSWVFNKPFYLLLNLAVGGTWPKSPDASTQFPATMLVDWVRVYS